MHIYSTCGIQWDIVTFPVYFIFYCFNSVNYIIQLIIEARLPYVASGLLYSSPIFVGVNLSQILGPKPFPPVLSLLFPSSHSLLSLSYLPSSRPFTSRSSLPLPSLFSRGQKILKLYAFMYMNFCVH